MTPEAIIKTAFTLYFVGVVVIVVCIVVLQLIRREK